MRRHAVIAQPSGMNARRHKSMSKRVHLQDRRHARGITIVKRILAFRQAWRRHWLDRNHPDLFSIAEFFAKKRKDESREITAAADAADEDIRILARHLELFLRFQSVDGLMQKHRRKHRAYRVFVF